MGTRSKASRRRLLVGLWALVILLLVLVTSARGDVRPTHARPCTHGVSSIGPVEIVDGKVVGGSTIPHTEACLP